MSQPKGHKPVCAHYASSYLPLTENWIYRTVQNLNRFTPVFLSRKKQNLELFPIQQLYSLQDFGLAQQYAEIVLFKVLGYFLFFKRVCQENNVQILHVHFGYHGVKSLGLARALKIPIVCSFYGDDAFARKHARKYRKLFAGADKILVLGPYMKSRLVQLGCAEDKLQIHHLGIDVNAINFKQRTYTGKPIRFLIASSFLPKKGIDLALKALGSLRQYEFYLDIVGDGPLHDDLHQLADQHDLGNRITWHGYKPYAYFIELAYNCDVFIQASRTTPNNNKEGTPMAIVDAMATGMAVVSTKHSDIPEIVQDGVHGYLAEENDVISLQNCLENILRNPEKIATFSLQGRAHIEREFNTQTQGEKLETLYTGLIRKRVSG